MQTFYRTFLLLIAGLIATSNARPSQFSENNQGGSEQAVSVEGGLLDTGLKPWQLELLAQRLSEYNQAPAPVDFTGWERPLRNQEVIKRQSRYRQCYFNPISCFRK